MREYVKGIFDRQRKNLHNKSREEVIEAMLGDGISVRDCRYNRTYNSMEEYRLTCPRGNYKVASDVLSVKNIEIIQDEGEKQEASSYFVQIIHDKRDSMFCDKDFRGVTAA